MWVLFIDQQKQRDFVLFDDVERDPIMSMIGLTYDEGQVNVEVVMAGLALFAAVQRHRDDGFDLSHVPFLDLVEITPGQDITVDVAHHRVVTLHGDHKDGDRVWHDATDHHGNEVTVDAADLTTVSTKPTNVR